MADQKILLYHKDSDILRNLSQSLGSLGFSIISSSNYQYTMELAKQEKPNCLIWGDELNLQAKKSLKSLKESDFGRQICIFALGNQTKEMNMYDRVEAEHFGVDDFILDIKNTAEIQARITFHQKYLLTIRKQSEKTKRFRRLSEATISLMLSRGIANVCEILEQYIISAYPRLFHFLVVNTTQNQEFDYFGFSAPGRPVKVELEKMKMHPLWLEKFIGMDEIKRGSVTDQKVLSTFNEWGLGTNGVLQYPLQGRGKTAGVLILALPGGFDIDDEEEALLTAFFHSASQRLTEVKRIYSLDRDGTKKHPEIKNYFGKPSEDEILIMLSKLLIGQLHPDICLYINYHEGFKFLYPKHCFTGESSVNLFEKEKPPVLLLKDYMAFDSVIQSRKTEIIDLKKNKENAKITTLPGLNNQKINNVVIIPLIVSQTVHGFFVIGRQNFIEKFSNRELKESENLIIQAAEALEEDQILKTAKLTVKQLNKIFELGSELTLDISLEKLLEKVSMAIRRTIPWG